MQWSQVLLILMGQFSFLTCQLYEYHFVEERKNWTDARDYCKKHYTDLATVYDNTEGLIPATEHEEEAWIGLHKPSNREENWVWHWSLPGEEYDADESQWDPREPNNLGTENCATIESDKEWNNFGCEKPFPFICYNAKNPRPSRFQFIVDPKNWTEAQKHCREHHTDLISGRSQLDEAQQQNLTLTNVWPQSTWIGLFSDTWTWAAGSNSSFRNWELGGPAVNAAELCATVLKNSGKWASADCTSEKPFVCYEDKVILIEENKSWGEALDYCRENYYDLVSITSPGEQLYVQEKAQEAGTPFVWLGLRYTCTLDFWFWISDEVVEYDNWNGTETDSCGLAGAMDREGKHQWFKKPDEMEFNFICTMC